MQIFHQHPQRASPHNEVHARPPEPMCLPLAVSHIVMTCDAAQSAASSDHLARLLRDHLLAVPDLSSTHLRMDLGAFRTRWELHTEFVSWSFARTLDADRDDGDALVPARDAVLHAWLSALPGQCLVAIDLWANSAADVDAVPRPAWLLNDETLVASSVADRDARVYTDLAVHSDEFSRIFVVTNGALTPRRLGQLVQRLLEIETYRMAALLGLPAARLAAGMLSTVESEVATLANAIRTASHEQEPQLLDQLTRLAAQVEGDYAATHSRFSASAAHFELVDKRIRDIAESRLPGMQTIAEFMDRRLSPARSTCEWVARRQEALSRRISRISNLLRTRVEIEQQLSSQALLKA